MNSPIAWFVNNPVATKLVMLMIVVGGLVGLKDIGKTAFPSGALDRIEVSVPLRGAGALEVESRVLIPIEEAVNGLPGIKRIEASGYEGFGTVTIVPLEGHDVKQLLNEVKAKVDEISTFPSVAERPIIRQWYAPDDVMFLFLSGDISEKALKELGRTVRDRVAELPGAAKSIVDLVRDYEISIEVAEYQLQKYGLSFDDITAAIQRSSVNAGAGVISSKSGQTELMTRAQAYVREDFEKIVVLRQPDGTQVLLGDVATVVDGFTDNEFVSRYNGKRTVMVLVRADANPDVVALSTRVKEMIEQEIMPRLPDGVSIDILIDRSDTFKDRLDLLLNNGLGGLALVFVGLLIFLTPSLAAWVTVGICVSFMGCFWLLPYFGIPLSMLSLFAFVLILGIVVDDAIIVGESIHRKNQLGLFREEGAIQGAGMVAKPVIFSALTTMIAFSPILFVPGMMRNFVYAIPMVVILTLVFSLIESLCILPMHLRTKPRDPGEDRRPAKGNQLVRLVDGLRARADSALEHIIFRYYRPFLGRVLRRKFLFLCSFLSVCFFVVSFVAGGWLKFSFMPVIPDDFVYARMVFPEGVSLPVKERALLTLEDAANRLRRDLETEFPDRNIIKDTVFWVGENSRAVQGYMALEPSQSRAISSVDVGNRWRALVPAIADVKQLEFKSTFAEGAPRLSLLISGQDAGLVEEAGARLQQKLLGYEGVYEVVDSAESARTEAVLSLLPGAENLNLSQQDLARQVRHAFYGAEVQRIPRGRDTLKVMVRLPKQDRKSFDTLQALMIRTAEGDEVPFESVAQVEYRPGITRINRTDRKRTLTVTAAVDEQQANMNEIREDLQENFLAEWRLQYPQLAFAWGGVQEGEDEFARAMAKHTLFALFAIYFLLAVAFRSFGQPLIILTAIPCGYVGAVVGHLILGIDLSVFSILGIVATAGVVVNDNLVLMDYINRLRAKGAGALAAIEEAAGERFRPIFLTSFTTFIGLVPLMLERSVQAQFMIPTVVSLAFGVLFATSVTLLLVPVLYLLMSEARDAVGMLFRRNYGGRPGAVAALAGAEAVEEKR